MTWYEVAWLAGLSLTVIAQEWRLRRLKGAYKTATGLISEETRRKEAHTKAFERLTDPTEIEKDFERGAIASEALRANREIEVRPNNTAPPAIIHRVRKMRSVTPRRWNPPADYSDRLRDSYKGRFQ